MLSIPLRCVRQLEMPPPPRVGVAGLPVLCRTMTEMDPIGAGTAVERSAVADVLRVIIRSPADLDATLQTILDHAVRLCRADKGFVYLRDGDV